MHEDLWKSQEEEPMSITAEEACALAHKHERQSVVVYWGAWAVALLLIGGFVRDLVNLRNPWIVAGLVWTLATFLYMAGELLRKGVNRMATEEPCVVFLRRELQGKRRGLVRIQQGILLLVPGILAVWWGGGSLPRLAAGPAPFIMALIMLAFCWFSFWTQTRKVDREIERLGRSLN
jgi:hypothetical protein